MSAHEQNRKLLAIAINGFIVGNLATLTRFLRESMASFPLFDATLVPLAGENREKAEPVAVWRRSPNILTWNNESLAPRD